MSFGSNSQASQANQTSCGCKGIRTCLLCKSVKKFTKKSPDVCQDVLAYRYCDRCDICWLAGQPVELKLSGILVVPEFISDAEQEALVSAIDGIPWMPSQSGRRKQDFGPKVNFKKRKLKIGNFSGFPEFAFPMVKRFSDVKSLADFEPVELCHLEYEPERGSAIEPHLDDSWLWGERLVTLNLLSDTVLTLSPCDSNCNCAGEFRSPLQSRTQRETPDSVVIPQAHQCSIDSPRLNESYIPQKKSSNCEYTELDGQSAGRKIEIHVNLPAKSLLVLSSCARHHWCHEIKRNHVVFRRLAMTFRELSQEFEDGGSQAPLGQDLLTIAKKIADL